MDNGERIRREIYSAFFKLDLKAPLAIFEFQLRLSDLILEAEKSEFFGKFNRHEFLLRRCQDALAFRLIVPHAIRQLLGNASCREHQISSQGEAFQVTINTARRYAENGHSVLIADLSHLIRVGDLIICDNPSAPSIVEVKSGSVESRHAMQGRRGRQLSRSHSTIEYLVNDQAHIFGQTIPKLAVQSEVIDFYNWLAVEAVCLEAFHHGMSVVRNSIHDVLVATNISKSKSVSAEPIYPDIRRMRSACFASHAVGLLNPDILSQPPLVWPVHQTLLPELMEEKIVVGHCIDLGRFMDPLEEGFCVIDVSFSNGFRTERNGEQGTASPRFINNVLYGYSTIESTVAAMREMHDLSKEAIENMKELKPLKMTVVSNSQLHNFIAEPSAILETKDSRLRIVRDEIAPSNEIDSEDNDP